ncbi:acyl-CoA reductase-like NAD-dependent aldehyde dehydrogenase [Actinoplanes campanulatus]|uniref:Acyl-CoA reductase-like NAD-dependent aldehyde dehydrogenase n=1 Tax=Actinoplanes campanulatus TaxID=113559 RepID=A0A7W5AH80_9ACTN|nr:aldehyde dehydrogenase family protein [Actinoplanes campanulatus]MBB3095899.1 acyl-CoA reductase-like NAD-dependent aldehyde dehydrogenase [Actinoplanes campanulatus]GGN12306.1 aldehyde dehydrogenase [Actinoplanes campanulatus]GID37007.1 aldehyde dehydrogenase [Actinoplanes campanulatus]
MTEHEITEVGCLIAGSWVTSGPRVDRVGPWLRRVVSTARQAGEHDVETALGYAGTGARMVARMSPAARADVLDRAAAEASRRRDDLARLLALELGKPVQDGHGEIDRVADTFAVSAAEARRLGGEVLPVAGWARGVGTTALTYRAPAGVALAITPFNAPANLLAHKLGASFAAGNSTIVKPPPQAPASSAAVVRLLLDCGMPAEAVQMLHGGAAIGSALSAAPQVAVISFTGSPATGAAVARAAGAKRLVMELGGNAATIVCEDADLAAAAAICAATGYSNSGQSCISVQRVYVDRRRYAEFLDLFTERVRKLRVGDPLDPATAVGSMVGDDAAERVVGWAREAAAAGATITTGGERDGATVTPTVVADPPADARLIRDEVFGAVVSVSPFDDFDDVLATCNDSRYGLQAGLFTHDLRRVVTAWRELEVGGLIVNGSSNFRLDHVPFGGVKDSGFGRESPRWMIDDYTVLKTLMLRGLSLFGDQEGTR